MAGGQLASIQFDQATLDAVAARVRGIPKALNRIVPRALNKAVVAKRDPGSVYNLAVRRVGQALPIKKSLLKKRLFANRAKNIKWEASIVAGRSTFFLGTDIPVQRTTSSGVNVPRLFGRTVRLPRAFIPPSRRTARMRAPLDREGKQLTWREAEWPAGLAPRFPVMVVRGPAIEDAWKENPEIAAEVARVGRRRVVRALYIETENEIVKRMPR